ncbi:SDR family NAD(P)-dependent oxidoreductase [Vibrio rhizosphaerae]|nr:SDR family NAD(P)-dependent oxidoreductase [Vibrio rhizosphaerae]
MSESSSWKGSYLKRLNQLSKNQLLALALRQREQLLDVNQQVMQPDDTVAIVGIGCRFPGGVVDTDSYWKLLCSSESAITQMTDERWHMQGIYDPNPEVAGKIHTRSVGLLDQVDKFDASFFSITPREAESMDPQQRLLLEVTWEAIENSGHACSEFEGKSVGLFIGMMNKDYLHLNAPDMMGVNAKHSPYYASGEAFSIGAGRLAYILGLRGPCMTLDTACSSSLVGVHLACQSLLKDECDYAIAGGSSLILSPEASIVSSNARMLSPTGQCWTFDEKADGYVRSEGCAVVALKRLSDALADGDPVVATIAATAVNHNGRSQGLTAPSSTAQAELMQTALKKARIQPSQVRFIEAHGTGTPLGDPIEMNSIQSVYGQERSEDNSLKIGSVKALIGHTEASAGVAGLIKLALCVSKNRIIPQRNFTRLNPHIRLLDGVEIATETQSFSPSESESEPFQLHYGAVNSFGFSGSNAHAIVSNVQLTSPIVTWRSPQLLTISAETPKALLDLMLRYRDYISDESLDLQALAYTSQVGRDHFPVRIALDGEALSTLRESLDRAISSFSHDRYAPKVDHDGIVLILSDLGEDAQRLQQKFSKSSSVFAQHFKTIFEASFADTHVDLHGLIDLDKYALGKEEASYLVLCALCQTLRTAGVAFTAITGTDLCSKLAAASAVGMIQHQDGLRYLRVCLHKEAMIGWQLGIPSVSLIDIWHGGNCSALYQDIESFRGWLEEPNQGTLLNSGVDRKTLFLSVTDGFQTAEGSSVLPLLGEHEDAKDWDTIWATLYEAGLKLHWEGLYSGTRPRRLVLPNYVFQRRHYWPENAKTKQLHEVSPEDCHRFKVLWQEETVTLAAVSDIKPCVILIEGPIDDLPMENLPSEVTLGVLPKGWQERAVIDTVLTEYHLDRSTPVELLVWFRPHDSFSTGWHSDSQSHETIVTAVEQRAKALLNLTQALLERTNYSQFRFGVVTEGVESISERTAVNVVDGLVNGFIQTLCMEQPQLRPRCIDLDPNSLAADKFAQIVTVLYSKDDENHLAFRQGRRYIHRLAKADRVLSKSVTVRHDRAYLITGGLGGIGLSVARWLSRAGAGQILLVSRRGSEAPDVAERLATLKRERMSVTLVQADVQDYDALRGAVESSANFPLAGFIHSAGQLADASLQNLTHTQFQQVFQSKVVGALNLHRLSQEMVSGTDVDLFLLFSSIASLVGSAGQANYTSANGFTAALGRSRRAVGLPATVIHWGPWSDVGMASDERLNHKIERSGLVLIDPDLALSSMLDALTEHQTESVIAQFNWPRINAYLAERVPLPLLSQFTQTTLEASQSATIDASSHHEDNNHRDLASALKRQNDTVAIHQLAKYVETTIRQVLAIDSEDYIDPKTSVLDMGMDSLLSVELRNRFATELDLKLPVSLMFDKPTIDGVSRLLLDELRQQHKARAEETETVGIHSIHHAAPIVAEESASMEAAQTLSPPVSSSPVRMDNQDIAIIGVGCRLPGGSDGIEAFWNNLIGGVDLVSPFDGSRWDINRFYSDDVSANGRMYSNDGGQITNVHGFDNQLFGLSDREAEYMDPQQRIALEVAWETIESAAYTPESLADQGGIFIGPGPSDFADLSQRHTKAITGLMSQGHHISAIPGRIAYHFDWKGPCMAIDTACSSSLVAVLTAAQHLNQGDCRVALAGGVNLILSPANNIVQSKAGMLSPSGRCRTFDSEADGYIRSEGCAMVLLKRLSDAERDGDVIWGVIKGGATNQNGQGQSMTAPSALQQANLIESVLTKANLQPSMIRYVEAHGTGTKLGDPIEMSALQQTYGSHHDAENPLYVGSVKSNLGHTESAAGAVGLLKVLLMLKHRQIPPNLHLHQLNPLLEIDESVVRIPTTPVALKDKENNELMCAVSSFGFSGTNAHLVVAAYDNDKAQLYSKNSDDRIFCLSARTPTALLALSQRYISALESLPTSEDRDTVLANSCYSSLVGRCRHQHTMCLYPDSYEDLIVQLRAIETSMNQDKLPLPQSIEQVAFCLTLSTDIPPLKALAMNRQQQFVDSLHMAEQSILQYASIDLHNVSQADISPALRLKLSWFCVHYATIRWLMSVGIQPDKVLFSDDMWLVTAVLWQECTWESAIEQLLHGVSEAPSQLGRIPLERTSLSGGSLLLSDFEGVGHHCLNVVSSKDDSLWRNALGTLWCGGRTVNWDVYFEHSHCQRRLMPTYPFERRDCSRPQGLVRGENPVNRMLEELLLN